MIEKFGKTPELVDLEELKTWIIFEDEKIIAVNKPGWLVCHPSKNGPLSSLVGAMREMTHLDTIHLVSRLDRETSGVVVFAKDKKSASTIQKAIESKIVGKTYLAILRGTLAGKYTVCQPLADDKNSSVAIKQIAAIDKGAAKPAETLFTPLRVAEAPVPLTLAKVEIITGRKHQIRAHAEWIGKAVVGDKIYGGDENIYLNFIENGMTEEDMQKMLMPRQALHAWILDFSKIYPGLVIKAKIPQDFAEFMLENSLGSSEEFDK
ncbi:MAG: RNA pseudouridine synthase [Opitutales bacterium]|nr:RNA pseudouridine synthase [Opitutales bacterium]